MVETQPDAFYPNLFAREGSGREPTKDAYVLPQNTLYDAPLQPQHTPQQKHMTVFGFSAQNRQNVLMEVKKLVSVEKKEDGKNYLNIWADDPAELDRVSSLNHRVVNGEIIGVIRRNFGAIKNEGVYASRKGIFQIIKEYFFGE